METQVGYLSADIIKVLNLSMQAGVPIFLGSTNITHMKNRHPYDYARYHAYIPAILATPDYVGQNPKDGSIEYVKEFQVDGNYVKVAVRLSNGNRLFARSLYILNSKRVSNFIKKGTLKKI